MADPISNERCDMKIDLIRYWKDKEYAKSVDTTGQPEANPAGQLLSRESRV